MKTFFIKNLLTSFLLVVFATLSFGLESRPPIVTLGTATVDDDGGAPIILYTLESCDTEVIFRLYLTNLFSFDPDPTEDPGTGEITEYFPENETPDHPDMYLQYYVAGGPVVTEQLTTFRYDMEGNIFVADVVSYSVNLSDECAAIPSDEEYFSLNYEAKLVTTEEDEFGNIIYKPYPVCDFVGPGDIFSYINSFAPGSTFPNASISNGDNDLGQEVNRPTDNTSSRDDNDDGINCADGLASLWDLRMYCDGCLAETPDGPGDGSGDGQGSGQGESITGGGSGLPEGNIRNDASDFEQGLSKVTVHPNPFNNQLEIRWLENENIESMELFDINGKRINSWAPNQLSGRTDLNVDTNIIPKGLYFLKTKYADSMEVIKVVKQ